jgi:hypothetical protein
MAAMEVTIAPCFNDSMIHDIGILNPVISMYLVSKNHRDIDTVTNATRYIRESLGDVCADTGDADIPLT